MIRPPTPDGTGYCKRCQNLYNSTDIGEDGICIDCQEGCCGTSKAPRGWFCTRPHHDEGPCAAHPICDDDHWVFAQPMEVRCPCWAHGQAENYRWGCCKGHLRSDGRNNMDTLTFLVCDACSCCFVARDLKEKKTDDDVDAGDVGERPEAEEGPDLGGEG